MCKFNAWFVVKSLVFVGGVYTLYKLGTTQGERIELGNQEFVISGKDAKQFVQGIMEQKSL